MVSEPKSADEVGAALSSLLQRMNGAKEAAEHATTSRGIRFHLRPVSQVVVARARAGIVKPEVPEFVRPDGRTEPNESHPDYLDALEAYHDKLLEMARRIMVTLGTELVELPEGMAGPDDPRWVEEVEAIGVTVDTSTHAMRYSEWLSLYALSAEDWNRLWFPINLLTGTLESEVMEAIEFFRRRAFGDTDSGGAPEQGDTDRDQLPLNLARSRARNGGADSSAS